MVTAHADDVLPEKLRQPIKQALQEREQKLTSCRFKIEVTTESSPALIARNLARSAATRNVARRVEEFQRALTDKEALKKLPPIRTQNRIVVRFAEGRYWTDKVGEEVVELDPVTIQESRQVDSADGSSTFDFRAGLRGLPYPIGFIREQQVDHLPRQFELLPVLAWFRPSEGIDQESLPLEQFSVDEDANVKDGILAFCTPSRASQVHFDPSRDYVVTSYIEGGRRNSVRSELNIEYEFDQQYSVWVPVKWILRNFDEGDPWLVSTYKVTAYEINPTFTEQDFQFTFPPGTEWRDERPVFVE
ncbi:MAG: hypothetical protein CMJ46_13480 [Planctomyces sp.]|nr:hypothetical protein [Planctomyces sp.]